jgi:L-2,4-diaminobutyrate decarboxylase
LNSHLLDATTTEDYLRLVQAGAARVAERVARAERPFTGMPPSRLEPEVAAIDLDRPLHSAADALDELEQVYLRDAVYFHHPRYLAHLNCPVALPALLGETVLAAVNSSLDTWDQSAGATLIEQRLIAWTAQRIGFGPSADGVFTSGGTQTNLHALLLARDEAIARAARAADAADTTPIAPRLRIFASQCAHFSVVKAARLLGLGDAAVVSVPCDSLRRMQPGALARALASARRDGLIPMAVVATAGTTDFGSIDPLPAIAGLCAQEDVWLHVDAAYGCGLLASVRRRHLLAGIEYADSVTVDYHKSFFQPVSSSALIVRDRSTLSHVTYHADYLNPATPRSADAARRVPNQVDKSLQTTRRFDALKLWLTLRMMGADAVGELFDSVVDLAGAAWLLLDADPRFEAVVRPQLSTLVFRYVGGPERSSGGAPIPAELCDEANRYAREQVAARGEAMVAATVVDGRRHLKFTLLNPRTTIEDVAAVLNLLAGHASEYLGDRIAPSEPAYALVG